MTQNINPPAPPPLIRQSKTKCSCCDSNVSFAYHDKCVKCADKGSIEFNYHKNNIKNYFKKVEDAGYNWNNINEELHKYY